MLRIVYPWQSRYSTFNNSPIYFTDPLGLYGKKRAERKRNRDIKNGRDVGKIYNPTGEKRDYGYAVDDKKKGWSHDFGKRNKKSKSKKDGIIRLKGGNPLVSKFAKHTNAANATTDIPGESIDMDLFFAANPSAGSGLPRYDYTHWEFYDDLVKRVINVLGEVFGFETYPVVDKKVVTDNEVKKEVKLASKDSHKTDSIKKDGDGYLLIFLNDILTKGNLDSNNVDEDIYNRFYKNDTNVVKDF
jgi:hypothetical protein